MLLYNIMPFIVLPLVLLNISRNMQMVKPQHRVSYLKNFLYSRISTYSSVFIICNLLN